MTTLMFNLPKMVNGLTCVDGFIGLNLFISCAFMII